MSCASRRPFLQVGHLGLTHRFLKLVLKFRGHAADLAGILPERAHDAGQFLRTDEDKRDDADEKEFGPTDVEHEMNSGGVTRRSSPAAVAIDASVGVARA